MAYFLIYASDDGGRVRWLNPDEVPEMLEEGEEFYDKLPDESDMNYWRKNLIVKGEVVSPKPVERVTTWELP